MAQTTAPGLQLRTSHQCWEYQDHNCGWGLSLSFTCIYLSILPRRVPNGVKRPGRIRVGSQVEVCRGKGNMRRCLLSHLPLQRIHSYKSFRDWPSPKSKHSYSFKSVQVGDVLQNKLNEFVANDILVIIIAKYCTWMYLRQNMRPRLSRYLPSMC